MLHFTRGGYDAFPFTSHFALVLFGRACAEGQREEAYCRGATGAAASVPECRSERLTGFRPSGPTGHAYVVVDERHIHHIGALDGLRRGAGFYDSEAFSIDHLYRHSHGSGRLGPCQHASHYHTRAPSGCGTEAFPGRDPVRPTADEGPRRTDPGDQVRRPPHVGRAEPAGGETAVPVRNTGRDLRRA